MAHLIVFLGAGLGGMLRHVVNVAAMRLGQPTHVGTLFINVTGSCLIGAVVGYFALKGHLPPRLQLFLTTGILGGYTTFSAFSLETVLLVERGQYTMAAGYVIASAILSILATLAAMALIRLVLE